MKKCSRCGISKSESDFNWKSIKTGLLKSLCRECDRKYSKQYYHEVFRNKQIILSRKNSILRTVIVQEYVFSYLQDHFCVDCGETDILVLEFDHEDPKTKVKEIGKMRSANLELVKAEIAKCSVRCRNCHIRRTHKQFNTARFKYTLSGGSRALTSNQ